MVRENANNAAAAQCTHGDTRGLIEEIASAEVARQLHGVGDALTGVADSLAAHFADWGAVSRFASAAGAASGFATPSVTCPVR